MDIEIGPTNNPDAGFIKGQRIVPGERVEGVQDDLLREAAESSGPPRPSDATMDDSPEDISD